MPPFDSFARSLQPQSPLRAVITAAWRQPETDCVPPLLDQASLTPARTVRARALATRLVEALRAKAPSGGVEGLIHEYALSSQEGVALMCLAEALLRIPDDETRDALIRDKIGGGDWRAHLGHSPSLFVNAATWGLLLTGRLTADQQRAEPVGGADAPDRARRRAADPHRRQSRHAPDGRAVRRRPDHRRGARQRPRAGRAGLSPLLRHAGRGRRHGRRRPSSTCRPTGTPSMPSASANRGRGIYEGSGISIKLSALHPRYGRAQMRARAGRTLSTLQGAGGAARGSTISGSTSMPRRPTGWKSRSTCSSGSASSPSSSGWNGIGFVVQAYQKRALFTIDWLIDLARRSQRRLMVRLVKGAYWDSEIKRAQLDGLEGFPVFTRRIHTDVSYLACARRLLAAPDAAFPAVRDSQCADARHHPRHGRREFLCRPVRVPVPARHGRAALRRGGGTGKAQPAVPHLRAGRHARDPARLSGAPPAGERRQHLVREPDRQSTRSRSIRCWPIPSSAPAPCSRSARRIRRSPCRATCSAPRKNSRGLDLANEQVLATLAATLQAGRSAVRRAAAGRRRARGHRPGRDQSRRSSRHRGYGDRGHARTGRCQPARSPGRGRSSRRRGRRSCARPPT